MDFNKLLHYKSKICMIVENDSFETVWYRNEIISTNIHSIGDKPAIIDTNGSQWWYQNGKLHRDDDKPAVIVPYGTLRWVQNGKLHRENDKPPITWTNGSQWCFKTE
jgi:hypothetical protein